MNKPQGSFPMTGNQTFSFAKYKGRYLLLYFYPKDNTPGCTLEGREFSELKPEFDRLNTVVFGVSKDSIESHEKFKEKQCYQIDLISDASGRLCQYFDVIKEKNLYGKKSLGIERSTFLLDPQGKVIKEWRKVKAEGHAAEVLQWIKQNIVS
ncbi:MAG: peroxiredoxin [Bdellovibrionaceae bacterium]|nr:peroxiredoxin [Pseudobdellovibrionaceae bacterium]MDW8190307.1 peroxiredoxin [Pseudobdellovibrionaceae bacterium]